MPASITSVVDAPRLVSSLARPTRMATGEAAIKRAGAARIRQAIPLEPLALGNVRTLCRGCHLSAHMTPERRAWRALMREGV